MLLFAVCNALHGVSNQEERAMITDRKPIDARKRKARPFKRCPRCGFRMGFWQYRCDPCGWRDPYAHRYVWTNLIVVTLLGILLIHTFQILWANESAKPRPIMRLD
jgi:hypothetical protein